VIRYERQPDSLVISDIQAFLGLNPQADPEHRYDYEEVIFPAFEAPDHYERWDAFTIIALLNEQMQQRKANGDPPLTPADVCRHMDAYLVSQYHDLLPDFQLVYLKGALLREIAWQDDIKHYEEDPTIHGHLPDWHPLLALVEQALQAEQKAQSNPFWNAARKRPRPASANPGAKSRSVG
jgi:hypothetical protein